MLTLPDLTSAPRWLSVGRKRFLVAPLRLVDVGWYRNLGGQEEIGAKDLALLLWLSVRQWQPEVTLRQVQRWFRRPKVATAAIELLADLNAAMLKPMPADKAPKAKGDDDGDTGDHAGILRALGRLGFTPQAIGNMTPAQVECLSNAELAGMNDRLQFGSREAAQAYVRRRQDGIPAG